MIENNFLKLNECTDNIIKQFNESYPKPSE